MQIEASCGTVRPKWLLCSWRWRNAYKYLYPALLLKNCLVLGLVLMTNVRRVSCQSYHSWLLCGLYQSMV